MKFNIQKVIKCLTCLVTCFMVVVCAMTTPANAEVTYPINAADYVSDVVYDGNNKTVICDFTGLPWSVQFGGRSSETVFATGTNVSQNYINEQYIFCYCYPFKNNVYTGGIDISGIAPGSPFELTFTYDIVLELFGSHSLPGTVEIGCNFSYYDSNKQRIGDYSVSVAEYTLDNVLSGTTTPYSMDVSGVVPVDAVYLNCYLGVDVEIDSVPEDGFGLTMYLDDLAAKFRIDYNMLDVQSDLMQAANNKLDDIQSSIDNVGDKIDGTNDRLDQIITGGEAGDKLEDAAGNLDNSSDQFDDTLGDYQDKADQLPTTPSNFDDIIDNDLLDSTIKDAQKIFDWDASGLNYMFVPMGISLSLAVLFYVVFGRE